MPDKRKHIIGFTFKSQGNIKQEVYAIGASEKGEDIARKLLKWFNLTGGNNDGSFRVFDSMTYDKFITEEDYNLEKIKFRTVDNMLYEWSDINYLNVDLRDVKLVNDRFEQAGYFLK